MSRDMFDSMRAVPGNAQAWFALGLAALEAGRNDEASYALVHSVQLAPDELDRALVAADRLVEAEAYPAAEEILRAMVQMHPGRTDLRLSLGRVLLAGGNERGALAEVDRALDEDPHDGDLRVLAAGAHERLGELEEAAHHLHAVLTDNPEHRAANRQLGVLLCKTGRAAEAVGYLRRALAGIDPASGEPATLLGIELSRQGEHAQAIALLQSVIAAEPGAAAWANLGMALLAAGNLPEAIHAFQSALEIEERSAQATCGLGLAYQRLGQWPEAAEAFRATERLVPGSPIGPLNLGLALHEMGDAAGARDALLRAAQLAPGDEEIQQALAQLPPGEATPSPSAAASGQSSVTRPIRVGPSIAGDLRTFDLYQVLEFLRIQNKTGSLVLSSRQGAGLIRLARGEITSASAPGVPRLGRTLVESGLVLEHDLRAALGKQSDEEESAETLGSLLLQQGLVSATQLGRAVLQQILDALAKMTAWSDGSFSLHPTTQGQSPSISFGVQQVLLEMARQEDETQAGKSASSSD
jgi:tetratricopeptide (TPR) repeat protein